MAEKDDIATELKKRHPHYVGAGVSITDVVGDLLAIIRENVYARDGKPLCSYGCCWECRECSAKSGSPTLCASCLLIRESCPGRVRNLPTHRESETVNHPAHYNAHPSGVECITVTEHMTFNVGNAVKYLWRAGHKGSTVEDLKKAAWYVQREIERLEKK